MPNYPAESPARRWLLFASIPLVPLALVALTITGSARASLVVARRGERARVREARVAVSFSADTRVSWEQLVLEEGHGEIVWAIEVPNGGAVEGADPRWLEALDAATAPVVAPAKSLGCDPFAREATAASPGVDAPRAIDAAATATSVSLSGPDAVERLRAAGFAAGPEVAAMLSELDRSRSTLALVRLRPGPALATPVVRIRAPLSAATSLSPSSIWPSYPLTFVAYAFARNRVQPAGVPVVEPVFEGLVWGRSRSNYDVLLGDARARVPDGAVVTFANRDGVFIDQAAGKLGRSIPSLVRRYFGVDDDAPTAAWPCATRVSALGPSTRRVAPPCTRPPPWALDAPTPRCDEPRPTDTPADALTCAGKDDLAAALAGSAPASTWLTRLEGARIASPSARPLEASRGGSLPSYHEARTAEPGACAHDAETSPPIGGGASPPMPRLGDLFPTRPAASGRQTVAYDDRGGCNGNMFAGCSRSSAPDRHDGSDGCGRDSRPSPSSSDDGCSKGSSKSSSDDGCGKGSSKSSSDDGCGKGSSSSSSDGGCGGGKSKKSSDNGCAIGRVPSLRPSAAGYLMIGLATILRRLGRSKRNAVR